MTQDKNKKLIHDSTEKNLDWQDLLEKFVQINSIEDQSQQQYRLVELAKQYEISLESLEKIFFLYQEQVEINKLKSKKVLTGPLLANIEYWLDKVHRRLKMMAIFPILEQVAKLSIIVGIVIFITECTGRENERYTQTLRTHYEAWNVIKTHQNSDTSSGGRKEAIEYLSKEGLDLSGINLSNAYLTQIKFNQITEISKMLRLNSEKLRALRINLENTVATEADFSNSVLFFANFKHAELWDTKFDNSDLARANFEGADLSRASFKNADLRCTNFLRVEYLKAEQVKNAKEETWELAIYNPQFYQKKLELKKRRNMLDDFSYEQENIGKHEDLKTLNFYCYGFPIDSILNKVERKKELKKIHERFYVFKAHVNNNFQDADFQYAYLDNLDLREANLENANLSYTYLNQTIFKGANLTYANLYKAKKLSVDELKLACNWEKAIYTEPHWDKKQGRFVAKDEKKNQAEIQKMKNDKTSNPLESPDCNQWE